MSNWRIGTESALAPLRPPRTKGKPGAKPEGMDVGGDQASSGSAGSSFSAILDRLVKWIPGDTLAIYLPGVTMLASKEDAKPSVVFLIVMILFSFAVTVGGAFATGAKISRRTWTSAVLGAIAFAIWSLSVPLSGWQQWDLVVQNQAAVAIIGATVGILFGLIAEGILRRAPD